MGILGWTKKLLNRGSEPPDPASSRLWFTGRTFAGVHVEPDSALRNATVWACVQY